MVAFEMQGEKTDIEVKRKAIFFKEVSDVKKGRRRKKVQNILLGNGGYDAENKTEKKVFEVSFKETKEIDPNSEEFYKGCTILREIKFGKEEK